MITCRYCKGDIVKVTPRYWTKDSYWRHIKSPTIPHKAKPYESMLPPSFTPR